MTRALLLALAFAGCSVYTRPLAQLSLRPGTPLAQAPRPAKSILILPFTDERGPEFARVSPERFIPVAQLVHGRRHAFYPEQASLLRTHEHHHVVVSSGTFGTALPSLLATEMGQMGLPDRVALAASSPADYVVTGRIVRTDLQRDSSFLLGMLAPLGVPSGRVAKTVEYEVSVYDARDRSSPILRRTYAWHGTRAVGMYYGHEAAMTLFSRALEATLPRVVADVAAAIDARG